MHSFFFFLDVDDYEVSENLPDRILSDDINEVTEQMENLMLLVILCNCAPYKLLPGQQTRQCPVWVPYRL